MSSPALPSPESSRSWLDRLWSAIADRGREHVEVPAVTLPPLARVQQLAETLLSERGEASGAAVARELHAALLALEPDDRLRFMGWLAEGFTPDAEALRAAAEAYLADPSSEHATGLFDAAEPPRQELIRRMNMTPGGTLTLVNLRRELLGLLRDQPVLRALDTDLKHLFTSWFNRGFLELRRIDWQTPAAVLEKLIVYEAVHAINGWDDLRRRLAPDRRCFAFFHPALPGEPLIFVEVALVEGLAAAVGPLLDRDGADEATLARRAARADTAIFYSISNCQEGLRGISFGNFLIKQVVEELKAEIPSLIRFSTLSPVPGFRRWLDRRRRAEPDPEQPLFRAGEAERMAAAAGEPGLDPLAAFERLTDEEWWREPARAEALAPPLTRLCAEYLTRPNRGLGAIDPVARFHLGNGAQLERINWLGNTGKRGIAESYGIMVNYLYDRDRIEANHETFARDGTVARSPSVDALLAPEPPPVEVDETPGLWRRFRWARSG